jgi:hypothetical protein
MRRLIALPLLLALAVPAAAEKKAGTDGRAGVVAPFLDEQTVAVAHVDLGRIDLDALMDKFGRAPGMTAKEFARAKEAGNAALGALKGAGVRDIYAVFTMAGIPREPVFLVVPLKEEKDRAVKKILGEMFRGGDSKRVGQSLVLGSRETLQRLEDLKPASHPELAQGFAAAGDGAAGLVIILPKTMRRAMQEALPNLPPELGGGSTKTITQGFSWAAVGVKLAPEVSLRATVQAKNAGAAKALAKLYENALKSLVLAASKDVGAQPFLPSLGALKELLVPQVQGSKFTLVLNEKDVKAVLLPAVEKVRMAAAHTQSTNNLKQLALAMHAYLDVYKTFPAHAIYDKQGRPLLSWRVAVLPFIEQQNLYQQFHLDEPWDSEHNKKLIARMPRILRSPLSNAAPGKTTYLVPVGKDTVFPPGPKGIQIRDITDGTSNTIMIVEADDDHAVTWTRPDDLNYNPQQPLKGLGGKVAGQFIAAFADGSVRIITRTINLNSLRALFTRNAGDLPGNY